MPKLVAIGDSLTQGFQSGAILRTDWSFPAIIARSLRLAIPTEFRVPSFPGTGLPLNLEEALRWMQDRVGNNLSTAEWIARFPVLLGQFIDEVEDLYERGRGARPAAYGGIYHNLAVFGFRVADSFTINTTYCEQAIRREEGWLEDDFLGLPSAAMYRTARRVLNPKLVTERMSWTQLDNLQAIVEQEGAPEILIIWLGSNDSLGAVLGLEFTPMPADFADDDPMQRRAFTVTHPTVFRQDFATLVDRTKSILQGQPTQVFVGNVPHVTIPPVSQGIPPMVGHYFRYYGHFFMNQSNFNPVFHKHLTGEEVQKIDAMIVQHNDSIREILAAAGDRWHLVDVCQVLDKLAVKRNELTAAPERALIDYYADQNISDHPLLRLQPIPNILRFAAQDDKWVNGGFFSLDCVHPSIIGYGLVAEVFLTEMRRAGIADADPAHLNWQQIVAQDSLIQAPPALWDNVIAAAENNATLWNVVFQVLA